MKLAFSHESALDLLRSKRSFGYERIEPSRVRTLEDCACSQREIAQFPLPDPLNRAEVLHVLAPSQERKFRSSTHICHAWRPDPPTGSLYRVDRNVYAATPELIFVQLANSLSPIEHMLLGMELCGTYCSKLVDGFGFVNCPAITTRNRLESYARKVQGMRGATTALKTLAWVIDGSNSPAESSLALYLCLPPRLGGYGMPLPDMNPSTPLGKRASDMLGQSAIRCDLHWPSRKTVLEYNSSQEHLNARSAAIDARRSNTLGYKNLQLITVTPQMISKPNEFDAMVRQLAAALGKRPAPNAFLLSKKRRELRKELFPWVST